MFKCNQCGKKSNNIYEMKCDKCDWHYRRSMYRVHQGSGVEIPEVVTVIHEESHSSGTYSGGGGESGGGGASGSWDSGSSDSGSSSGGGGE